MNISIAWTIDKLKITSETVTNVRDCMNWEIETGH